MIIESMEYLRRKVEQYGSTFRHPNLARLETGGPYALFPANDMLVTDPKMRWDKKWPNSDLPGVYAIFDQDGNVLYVGKAWTIGSRLSSYFHYEFPMTRDRRCHVVHKWTHRPTYVASVAVPKSSRFEAAALEEYLIAELKPSDNKLGIRGREITAF